MRGFNWATQVLNPNGMTIVDRFYCFSIARYCDRPTDHATRSVTIGRIYVRNGDTAMPPNNNE